MAQWLNGRVRRGIVCQHLCSIPNHALFLTALFNQCRLSPYGICGLQLIIITNDLFNRLVLCHPWMIRGLNPCGVHGLSAWIPWTICMDSMKIIKIMVICGLSVDSPWTEKLNLGVSTAKKNSMESMEHPWSPRIHVDSTRITWRSDKSSKNFTTYTNYERSYKIK